MMFITHLQLFNNRLKIGGRITSTLINSNFGIRNMNYLIKIEENMPAIIDMYKNFEKKSKHNYQPRYEKTTEFKKFDYTEDMYRSTLSILREKYPENTYFTYQEASKELKVSVEFIRTRVKSGQINAIKIGGKPIIHLSELTKIICSGVK